MTQHTCAIIKPDAVRDGNIGNILAEIVKNDMQIRDLFMIELTTDQAGQFYAVHAGKSFFDPLIEFTTSGKMIVMTLVGDDVVARWRKLIGVTDPAKAEENFKLAMTGAPAKGEGYLGLGRMALRKKQNEEAVTLLAKAAQLLPKDDEPWYFLGIAQLNSGLMADAEDSLQKSLKIFPRSARALSGLVVVPIPALAAG